MKNHINIKYIKSKDSFRSISRRSVFALISIFFFSTSCKKLVEVPAPSNSLVTSSVFNNDGTAIVAQLGVYANLENNLYQLNQYTGLSADELTNYSTDQHFIDFYKNALNAQIDGGGFGDWGVFYNYIYQENAIIEGIQGSSGMSSRVKQLMTGEAKFMRAYCYFELINLFGDVPLITTTDYKINSSLTRTSKDQIYNQIVGDLQSAQTLLSNSYLDASDNTGTTDRVRPTTWAADALLSKVYLYMGKYNLSEQQASLVIGNSSTFSLVSDLTKVFKMNSSEAIWQLTPPSGTLYTNEGNAFILIAPPGGGSNVNVTISSQLLNSFEPNDIRRNSWIGSYSQNGATWYFPYKYQDNNQATTLTEYSMVFRLAELYLIRAEARAQQGEVNATDDLNAIRNRAGLLSYSGTTDKASLLTAIAHERQVELFTENDRWYNLKRTNTVDAIMTVVNPQKGGTGWNSYQQLYPLAVTDLQFDRNLIQNTGY